jgi:23S rRNA pseudouridine1911/1915/1917 synthase
MWHRPQPFFCMKSPDSEEAEIVFCDNHVLVAVKPSQMLTQPDATGRMSLETYAKKWVAQEYKKKGDVFLHCIHRLDVAVSGLVLFARTSKALSRLNEQMREMEIQRIYYAEVEGILPKNKEGQLDHYLIHGDHRAKVGKPGDKEAKHARLHFKVVETKPQTTCVEIELETGRYHQIRAQFSAIGHPVAGDVRYGGRGEDGDAIRLHCLRLAFQHPVTKELLKFESPAHF